MRKLIDILLSLCVYIGLLGWVLTVKVTTSSGIIQIVVAMLIFFGYNRFIKSKYPKNDPYGDVK